MKKNPANQAIQTDCLDGCRKLSDGSVDLIYLDPPFCTQKEQRLTTRDRKQDYSFSDKWSSPKEYKQFIEDRLIEFQRVLSATGSIFYHCDRKTTHIARQLLDEIFGADNFQSEIIWYYRRWSNAKRGLLPAHQTIFWYSKTNEFKFFPMFDDYSPSTNVDQILQQRCRDESGKSVYAKDKNGVIIPLSNKKGVPLSDVWDIPFLNPKAKERTGYPTQKPILLLDRIIQLTTEKGDTVLDPFCGSGTTLVSAKLNERQYLGFDISSEAVCLSKKRLGKPIKSESLLTTLGRDRYKEADKEILALFYGCEIIPVQRNKGIDAFVKGFFDTGALPVRVQRLNETVNETAQALFNASISKQSQKMILVKTIETNEFWNNDLPNEIIVVESIGLQVEKVKHSLVKKYEKVS